MVRKKKPAKKAVKKTVKKAAKKAIRKPRSVPLNLAVPLNKEMPGYMVHFRRPEVNETEMAYGCLSLKDNRRGYIYEVNFCIERWGGVRVLGITAGCRSWSSFNEARFHYQYLATHLPPQTRKEAIARLHYLRAKLNTLYETLMPHGNAKPAVTFARPESLR